MSHPNRTDDGGPFNDGGGIPIHPGRPTAVAAQEAQAESVLQEASERREAAGDAPTTDDLKYAEPGTQAGGPRPVVEEEVPEYDWSELTTDQKLDALYAGVGHLMAESEKQQAHMLTLGQTLYRILVKAGEVSEDEGGEIVIPGRGIHVPGRGRMDVPK